MKNWRSGGGLLTCGSTYSIISACHATQLALTPSEIDLLVRTLLVNGLWGGVLFRVRLYPPLRHRISHRLQIRFGEVIVPRLAFETACLLQFSNGGLATWFTPVPFRLCRLGARGALATPAADGLVFWVRLYPVTAHHLPLLVSRLFSFVLFSKSLDCILMAFPAQRSVLQIAGSRQVKLVVCLVLATLPSTHNIILFSFRFCVVDFFIGHLGQETQVGSLRVSAQSRHHCIIRAVSL